MKNFVNLLLGYLLLKNIAALELGSFDSIKTIEVKGNAAADSFGWSVSSAGDFDGDGFNDLIVGAYQKNSLQGAAYVIYGGEASDMIDQMSTFDLASQTLNPVMTGFKITGDPGYNDFGYSVRSAGDIDNDGYDDILIGAHGEGSSTGAAYVIYGGNRAIMINFDLSSTTLDPQTTGFTITGSAGGDWFGCSVSSAGDINKDGYDDIIIGAYHHNNGQGIAQGAAYVIYGGDRASRSNILLSTNPLNPQTTGFMITGNAAGDWFGWSVSSAGDINNDEYDDVIIGAYNKDGFKGAAYVVYGGVKSSMKNIVLSSTTLDPQTTGFTITGNAAGDYFGRSVRNVGDINNDGYADIIIGAHAKNSFQGVVYIIYGRPKSSMTNINLSTEDLAPDTNGFMIKGNAANDFFGISVGSAGDINNDGYNDTIIGAYGVNNEQGAVYVIYGGSKASRSDIDLSVTTLDPETTGFSILGSPTNTKIGNSVGACDINNDGYFELLIGAWTENSYTGATYIIFNQCPTGCETCSSSSRCDVCSQGYVGINSLCEACPANCETCSSISKSCEVCGSPYLLYSGICLKTCPAQMFPENGACYDCPAGCSECSSLLSCQACLDGWTFSESRCIKDKKSAEAAAGAFEGTSLAGAALSSGSSLPFNFGLVAKLIRNFKYMALPVSQELYETFVSWKVASGFMSAPDSWSLKYRSKTIPTVFSRYELQSAFLINFWKPFVMSLVGIAVFGMFKMMEILMNKNNSENKNTFYKISRQVNVAASNFALTQFYSNLDDVMFYFVIEMRSTEFETGFRVGSSVLAIVLLLVGIIFIGLHSKLIAKYQNLKSGEAPMQLKGYEYKCENISLIFKDFKDTNSLIQSFLVVNVSRSVISSIIFATLFEYPMVQISFLFVLNLLMLVYLWKKKSFKDFINTCSQIFCEVILFIANTCVFLLALFDHADSYPTKAIEYLSKCIIILNYILLFGCALFMLFSLGKSLYQSYMEKKKAQVFPASAKLKNSDLVQSNHSLSTTNNGFINESQDHSHSDSFQNNAIKVVDETHDQDLNMRYQQQGNLNNSPVQKRIRSQNSAKDFGNSAYNTVLQSNSAEDIGQETSQGQANLFANDMAPRSRLVRNRAITQARIAQFSRTKENSRYEESPESRVQDFSLENFDTMPGSSPLRGNDLMPRRRAGTMNK